MVGETGNHSCLALTSNLEYNIQNMNECTESPFDEIDALNNNNALEFLYATLDDQLRVSKRNEVKLTLD